MAFNRELLKSKPAADKKKFLILDLYNAANKGDAAILEGLILSLKKETPHSLFIIHTPFPASVEDQPDLIVRNSLIPHLVNSTKGVIYTLITCSALILCALLARLKLNLFYLLPERYKVPFSDFLQADLIVGMGGGFYNDNYWVALPGRLCHLLIGKLLGKPVVISAHSFGPFKSRTAQILAYLGLNMTDALCVRDSASLQTLKALKIQNKKIYKVADSAWLVDKIAEEQARRLLEAQMVDLAQPMLISLSARRWGYYHTVGNSEGHACYVNALARSLDIIIEKYQALIIYLSTCHEPDRQVGLEIKHQLKYQDRFHIIKGEYDPSQLKGIYNLMSLHIGTRMHSVILALSAGTPSIGISYEPKLVSLMEELGLQEFVIDIENVEARRIVSMVEMMMAKREQVVTTLQREIPRLQQLAQKNAQIITHFVPK
jgi:polysaccharide pyruvyl transferase WcaK-like protein